MKTTKTKSELLNKDFITLQFEKRKKTSPFNFISKMMNKKLFLILGILLLSLGTTWAQGVIKGIVQDSIENPVAYANIFLKQGEKVLDKVITNTKGEYQFFEVESGVYDIEAVGPVGCQNSITQTGIRMDSSNIIFAFFYINCTPNLTPIIIKYEPPFEYSKTTQSVRMSGEKRRETPERSITPSLSDSKKEIKEHADFSKEKSVPSVASSPVIKSSLLTAGELSDFAKWNQWDNILTKHFAGYLKTWGYRPLERYTVQITNKQGMPLSNVEVVLQNRTKALWKAKTDHTGKAELWINLLGFEEIENAENLKITYQYEGQKGEISNVIPFSKGINTKKIDAECDQRNELDIFFIVDATGSMSDEIRYLQTELEDIISKTKKRHQEMNIRVGSLVYRDHGDEYLTRKSSLNSNIQKTVDFLKEQQASGGGDYPEAVDEALYQAIEMENWNKNARARIAFLLLDAPAHTSSEVIQRFGNQMKLAAEKGIRIVPVACSDMKKDGEYLMRCLALATNGTYLFLTDDSGIGNAHIKPTTDKYDVEKLNDAMVRIIKQYIQMPDCEESKWEDENKAMNETDHFVPNPSDEKIENKTEKLSSKDVIKVYPNPCKTVLKIEVKKEVKELYLVDATGKALFVFQTQKGNINEINMSNLASGIYFVKVYYEGRWLTEKIIRSR